MSSGNLGMIIEILVAMLLVMTISYCIVLNARLKALRADEHVLKATIGELLTATEIAERAIIGLKATTREAEQALTQKLRDAQTLRNELHALTGGVSRAQTLPAPDQRIAPPQPARQIETQQPAAPLLSTPQPQQVTNALRGLDQVLNAPSQPAAASPQQASHDFRVFTRSSFSSRG